MCGIAGLVSRGVISDIELGSVERVNHRLAHRGPDGDGRYSDSHVALAMRRLSIIDLEGGWQPLYNEERSLVLIANGEIYNYLELRQQLANRGHRFSTDGDIETILHLYEEHGLDCVHYLRGMFAFALWDTRHRRLVLGRDRMGEKPLYFFERNGQIIFASELKALLASGLVPFELDPHAVDLFFHYQYVPEPLTPIKGVKKLDGGNLLTIELDPWRVTEKCYWRMEDAPPIEAADPAEIVRQELETVSEIVIRSDVPVGVALSGGLDSSAIAALAARKYPGTIHAFSVGYAGCPASDERADARALADHLGMPFHDVEIETQAMVDSFPETVYWRDDPIADISGFGYYAVMKLAREHGVPVVLQGQGGDELFWGYRWVQEAAIESLEKESQRQEGWRALYHYLNFRLPRAGSAVVLSQWARTLGGLRSGWQRFQHHREMPADEIVFYQASPDFRIAADEAHQLYSQSFREQLVAGRASQFFTFPHPWPPIDVTLTRLICQTYLRENGVAQGDRLSMASSIELRLPLVDYRLVETVVGLRKAQSDLRAPEKAWFKAALKGVLPEWVMERPKRGFTPPVREWHNALFAAHGSSLSGGYLQESRILSPQSCEQLATGPFPARAITPISFKALVLEQWCRRMLECSVPEDARYTVAV